MSEVPKFYKFIERIKKHWLVSLVVMAFFIIAAIMALLADFGEVRDKFFSPATKISEGVPAASRKKSSAELRDDVTQLETSVQFSIVKELLGEPTFINEDGGLTECIFVFPECYVQVLLDYDETVMMYAVTTRNPYFRPVFDVPGGTGMGSIASVKLGETRFIEAGSPCFIAGLCGANWFHYAEYHYMANPGNYQNFIIAENQAGVDFSSVSLASDFDFDEDGFNEAIASQDKTAAALEAYRRSTIVNTYGETSAEFDEYDLFDSEGFPLFRFMIGPDVDQVNVLND